MKHIHSKRKRNSDDDEVIESDMDKVEKYVVKIKNHIYYYAEVTRESVLMLITQIKKATNEIIKKSEKYNIKDCEKKLFLHICSDGGSVYDGLAAMDTIRSNSIPITTIIEGSVCSAASFIALGGTEIQMRPSAYVLIHQITSSFWGKYEEFNDEKETLDKLMKMLRNMYTKNTHIPQKVLSNMFKKDIYINSDECMKWGFANKII
jgi:ATP-dependent Clp endopeptidase proteolytic subunit ClpP